MRRSVDRLASDRRAVLGRATARALALTALAAVRAGAGDGDGPELTTPAEMPVITSKPSTPSPTPTPAPSTAKPPAQPPRSRAVLALPGLTTPTIRPSAPTDGLRPVPEPGTGELSLDAPLEMRPLAEALPANPSRSGLPLIMESSEMDELPPPGGSTSRTNPPIKKPTTSPQPVQAPARRPRLFGFLGTAPPAPKTITPGRAVVADATRDDPAAVSALKRKIERQAREVVGNRAQSVEVKLDGKEAVVHVSGTKMFQKRSIRKQLEGIPALIGLRSTIQVED
jgi:hypothetical protein